jgi:hypothetical protein
MKSQIPRFGLLLAAAVFLCGPSPSGCEDAVSGTPIGLPDAYATTLDTPLAIEAPGLKANDLDPDGDDFALSSFTQPANGRITRIVTSGAFTYEPDPGFVGSDAFTYTLRDADDNRSGSVTVTIEVLPDPNRPPTTLPDLYSTLMGVPLAVEAPGLIANDLDLDGDDFVFSSFSQPAHGRLTRAVTNGSFTYEPDPGFVGTDAFTYTARDVRGARSGETTVTIQVRFPDGTQPALCDVNGDRAIDRNDIEAIFDARGSTAAGPDDPRDADGDGLITVDDGRLCVLQCTNADCKPTP